MKDGNSLGRAADCVLRHDVAGGPHGQPDAELVVLDGVAGHVGVERLQHRYPSVIVVVDVVVFFMRTKKEKKRKKTNGRTSKRTRTRF